MVGYKELDKIKVSEEIMSVSQSTTEGYRWYPVYTHARAEKKAHQALLLKGVDSYLPLRRQLKQWSDRKKWVDEPLIKSYLFVKIREADQAEVLKTRGIARFIYFGGKITPMPDRQIEDLRLVVSCDLQLEVTEENLAPGEKIIIRAGPLKGMMGEVVSYRSQRRLALRLEKLGCSLLIYAATELIERL